jgi:hypothetical protein
MPNYIISMKAARDACDAVVARITPKKLINDSSPVSIKSPWQPESAGKDLSKLLQKAPVLGLP